MWTVTCPVKPPMLGTDWFFKLSLPPPLPSTTAAQKHEHKYVNMTTRGDNYPTAVIKGR